MMNMAQYAFAFTLIYSPVSSWYAKHSLFYALKQRLSYDKVHII